MEKWQYEWPKEEGYWWFYGYRFGRGQDMLLGKPWEPGLYVVEVHSIGSGFAYVTKGNFPSAVILLYEFQAIGKWLKIKLPKLPRTASTPQGTKSSKGE